MRDRPFLSEFPGLELLRQDGSTVSAAEAFKGRDYVLVYFAAHWCPPCQRFTPYLADFYKACGETHNFEVLFVSSDREEGRMMDFFMNRSSNYVPRRHTGDAAGATGGAGAAPAAPISSGQGNWVALPFANKRVAAHLARAAAAASIPRMVVFANDTSRVVTGDGKAMVLRDPRGLHFPWPSAAVEPSAWQSWRRLIMLALCLLLLLVYWLWV